MKCGKGGAVPHRWEGSSSQAQLKGSSSPSAAQAGERPPQQVEPLYSSSATTFFLRAGLSCTEPGALCAMRFCVLRRSESSCGRREGEAGGGEKQGGAGTEAQREQQGESTPQHLAC